VSTSPALIAAAHVLHRLLAPRHPPCALVLLIEKNTLCVAMEFSRCGGHSAQEKTAPQGRSLKTQQRLFKTAARAKPVRPLSASQAMPCRGRHCSRRAWSPDDPKIIDGPDAYRSKSSCIP